MIQLQSQTQLTQHCPWDSIGFTISVRSCLGQDESLSKPNHSKLNRWGEKPSKQPEGSEMHFFLLIVYLYFCLYSTCVPSTTAQGLQALKHGPVMFSIPGYAQWT